jgi:hypothetical protein
MRRFRSPRTAFVGAALVLTTCTSAAVFAAGVAASSAAGAMGSQQVILYAVAEQEQYVNNSDSLTRGLGNNAFGNYKDLQPLVSKNASGPFPGDEALYSFNLYSSAGLKKRVGTATFVCQYNFNKNAFCDASFQMTNGGTLIASGAFNFTASKFALAVTGGYGAYVNKTGSLQETPTANHAQKLSFELN